MSDVPAKWRPSLAFVIASVCAVLVSLPLAAVLATRLGSNQFVRETERALIEQAAIYAAAYAERFAAEGGPAPGAALDEAMREHWGARWHPWRPSLDLRRSEVLPPLDDPAEDAPLLPLDPRHARIAPDLLRLARDAQRTTLSGVLLLDHAGRAIDPERTQDLGAAAEVREALTGRVGSSLRDRGDSYDRHPLTSISRDTWFRVFVAYPVLVDERVAGVVLLSRTPSNVAKFAVAERGTLAALLGATLLAAAIVGSVLFRLVSGPVRALGAQGRAIADGRASDPAPPRHYGVRELAELGGDIAHMARTLMDRSRQVATYTDHVTHELKSPLTAIRGAAELLDGDLPDATRRRLRATIEGQAVRMDTLLTRLREMARLRDAPTTGQGALEDMLPEVPGLDIVLEPGGEAVLPMLPEHGRILLHQLARNAAENGARRLEVGYARGVLTVRDDGDGIAPEHLDRVLDPFFTTRREEGGTGMGLAIVSALLQSYRARLDFEPVEAGTSVRIAFPTGGIRADS